MKKSVKYLSTGAVVLLFLGEFRLSYIEKAIGTVLESTNTFRKQTGAVWERFLEREAAAEKMGILYQKEQEDRAAVEKILSFAELFPLMESRESLIISEEKFMTLYRGLPRDIASLIISPLKLIEIVHDGSFRRCFLQVNNTVLTLAFLNQMNGILHQVTLDSDFYEKFQERDMRFVSSERQRFFSDNSRIVSREVFFQAFTRLDNDMLKVQIINDPFQLVAWGDQLQRIAILPEEMGVIPIIFEVQSGLETEYIDFQSRALAAYYLIQHINALEEKRVNPIR
ncbi:hypothetical protein ACFL6I_06025 [candidate division KSB1 bacterium]